MDEFLKIASPDFSDLSVPTIIDFILAYTVALVASVIIAYGYKKTHNGYSFSPSFMISVVLISVIISLIMIIIGSNIARAFALVGAMSIVRFRNPVKETRDLVFIFSAIAVGMAAGTGFYAIAVLFSVVFTMTGLLLEKSSIFTVDSFVHIIAINANNTKREAFENKIKGSVKQFTLLSMSSSTENGKEGEFVYEIEFDRVDKFETLKEYLLSDETMPSMRLIFGNSTVST